MPKLVGPKQRQALMATPDGQELLAKFDEIQVQLQTTYQSNAYKSGNRQVVDSHLQERNSVMEKISARLAAEQSHARGHSLAGGHEPNHVAESLLSRPAAETTTATQQQHCHTGRSRRPAAETTEAARNADDNNDNDNNNENNDIDDNDNDDRAMGELVC